MNDKQPSDKAIFNKLIDELNTFGYTKEEINVIVSENIKGFENELELNIDDLIDHMSFSEEYKKYPKSTLKHIIHEYNKRSRSISLQTDFKQFIDSNIETVDQDLWIGENSFLPYLDNADIYKFSETDEHHIPAFHKKEQTEFKQDYRNLISGFFSSTFSRTFVAPLDRLKMLYQVNYIGQNKPPSLFKGLKEIYQTDGFKGYFKGNLINITKGSPENGIKLYTFELTKWHLQKHFGENLSPFSLFFAGSLSGVVAQITIFPLEVLKLRIAASPQGTYSGIADAIRKIYREPKGLLNFYSGLEASICAVIPNAGLNLTVYEGLKIFFSGKKSINNAAYLSTSMLVFIGGFSAMISSTILYPFQIVQSRMIMYNLKKAEFTNDDTSKVSKYKFFNIIQHTMKHEGLKGFFKGYVPGITKIVIGNGIGFSLYEHFRKILGVSKRY